MIRLATVAEHLKCTCKCVRIGSKRSFIIIWYQHVIFALGPPSFRPDIGTRQILRKEIGYFNVSFIFKYCIDNGRLIREL